MPYLRKIATKQGVIEQSDDEHPGLANRTVGKTLEAIWSPTLEPAIQDFEKIQKTRAKLKKRKKVCAPALRKTDLTDDRQTQGT